jgi:hypothetical protein
MIFDLKPVMQQAKGIPLEFHLQFDAGTHLVEISFWISVDNIYETFWFYHLIEPEPVSGLVWIKHLLFHYSIPLWVSFVHHHP